tara:strand:+ start:738 stop:884 length:147 start_codon:yes stop_codon:yes gene_type:complete
MKKKKKSLKMSTHPIPIKQIIKSKRDKLRSRKNQKLNLKKMVERLEEL